MQVHIKLVLAKIKDVGEPAPRSLLYFKLGIRGTIDENDRPVARSFGIGRS